MNFSQRGGGSDDKFDHRPYFRVCYIPAIFYSAYWMLALRRLILDVSFGTYAIRP